MKLVAAAEGTGAAAARRKEVSLEEAVFGAELKPHLVHEAVRAELNERRQGTRAAKSRGIVSGGRAKPWRQKGTGRARQGTIRAPQFTGGGVAFPPSPRAFDVKVNKKALKAALRMRALGPRAGGHARPPRCGDVRRAVDEDRRCAARRPGARRRRRSSSRRRTRSSLIKSLPQSRPRARRDPPELEVAAGRVGALAARQRGRAAARRGEGHVMSLHPGEVLIAPGRLREELQPDRAEPLHVQGPPGRAQDAGPPGRRGAVRGQGRARQHHQGAAEAEAPRRSPRACARAGRRPSSS